jgi:lysyl-tRNA synthetase class 2
LSLPATGGEVPYKQLIRETTGDADWFARSKEQKIAAAEGLGLKVDPKWEDFEVTNEIFSKRIEPTLIQPTFVTHLPKELCPLAKLNREDPAVLDVFELVIGGMEIASGLQRAERPDRTAAYVRGPRPAKSSRTSTRIFSSPSSTGCRPRGAWASGSDRLCILLTGAESIRDIILFPQLRSADRA